MLPGDEATFPQTFLRGAIPHAGPGYTDLLDNLKALISSSGFTPSADVRGDVSAPKTTFPSFPSRSQSAPISDGRFPRRRQPRSGTAHLTQGASSQTQAPTVLLFVLNLGCFLELKQKGRARGLENPLAAGRCTCSPAPSASALSPSSGLGRLSPHMHTPPSRRADLQLASEHQDPSALPPSHPPTLLSVLTITHPGSPLAPCQDPQKPTAPLLLPVPHFLLRSAPQAPVVQGPSALSVPLSPIPSLLRLFICLRRRIIHCRSFCFNAIPLTLSPRSSAF